MDRDRYSNWTSADSCDDDPLWGIYARLSLSGDEDETSVDRQVRDGIAFAQAHGAKRIEIYVDDGESAYKRNRKRPQFERLLADAAAGRLAHIVAWKAERVARRPKDGERFLEALGDEDDPRAQLLTVADGIDTNQEQGRFALRLFVQFGEWESKSISRRVARAQRAKLERGEFPGGPRSFGHAPGWGEVMPEEAAAIRDAADRILSGEGVRSVVRDWNNHQIRTPRGNYWQHTAFRRLLTSPRMAGVRELRGEVVESELIAPILTREKWQAVRDHFADPKRRASAFGGQPRHLLTNLLRCGLCLSPLVAKGAGGRKNGQGYWTYGCVRDAARPMACGKVWIKGSSTDAYIESLIKAALLDDGVTNAINPEGRSGPSEDVTSAMQAHYRELRDLLLEREKAVLDGQLEERFGVSMESYRHWRAERQTELDQLQREISREHRTALTLKTAHDPIRSWEEADLGQRRAIIRLVMPDIRVQAARSIASFPQRWMADRIEITLA